ncbi:MAG TPA: PP2C family serine/threonine-protein phosphatase [Longimicrobiales bacterium]|nr:PP2C family serine/threonine-protein phosphatase [Longimicrobiales bacterium]
MKWSTAGLTDRGRRRARNEDAFLLRPQARIFGVADGMGGHAAGNVASRIAIDVLAAAFERPPSPRIRAATLARRLLNIFDDANRAILAHAAENRECAGMGTTLTALAPLAGADQCVIAHVGDSRAYRLRAGELTQLTRDHTWVQQQVDAGMLTSAEARHHPLASVLSRVLGTAAVGPADTLVVDAAPGDVFLLCSDGLTTMLDDPEVLALVDGQVSLEERARALIDAANQRGGVDNITVVLLQPDA